MGRPNLAIAHISRLPTPNVPTCNLKRYQIVQIVLIFQHCARYAFKSKCLAFQRRSGYSRGRGYTRLGPRGSVRTSTEQCAIQLEQIVALCADYILLCLLID